MRAIDWAAISAIVAGGTGGITAVIGKWFRFRVRRRELDHEMLDRLSALCDKQEMELADLRSRTSELALQVATMGKIEAEALGLRDEVSTLREEVASLRAENRQLRERLSEMNDRESGRYQLVGELNTLRAEVSELRSENVRLKELVPGE